MGTWRRSEADRAWGVQEERSPTDPGHRCAGLGSRGAPLGHSGRAYGSLGL